MKHGPGIYTCNNISVEELWDKGCRKQRVPLTKYFPPRVLKTVQSESGFVGKYSSGIVLGQQPREAERIKDLIDQLHVRLQTIESNSASGNQAGGSMLNPNSLTGSPCPSSASSPLPSETIEGVTEECLQETDNNETGDVDVEMTAAPAPVRPLVSQPADELCKICFEAAVNTILLKCGHIAFCLECANQLERCPVCRSQIDEVIQTFRA